MVAQARQQPHPFSTARHWRELAALQCAPDWYTGPIADIPRGRMSNPVSQTAPKPAAGLIAGPVVKAAQSVWALLAGMAFLMLGYGLQGSLLGLRATAEGFSSTVTGFVMSGYFAGFLLGSRFVPPMISRVGHLRAFAACASLACLAILVHSLYVTPVLWFLMRLLTGYSMASIYIITESWLNDRVENAHRGALLAVYMVITYLSMALGQLLLDAAPPTEHELFIVNACLIAVAAVPVLLSVMPQPEQTDAERLSLAELYRVSPLGLIGTLGGGFLQGSLFGMGAVYARQAGLSITETSYFMFLLIIGAAVLQWPFGKLSDRIDRRKAIAGLAIFGALATVVTVLAKQFGPSWLIACAPFLGAGPLLLYSLVIAYTNDHLRPQQMVAASSALTLLFGLGAMVGPPAAGMLMDVTGAGGFPVVLVAVQLAIFVFTIYRMNRRASMPVEAQAPYQAAPALAPPSGEWAREKTDRAAHVER
jgi:MFS family permease